MGCQWSKSLDLLTSKSSEDIRRVYKIGRLLGSGSFGQVRECQLRATEEYYAVKIMDRKSREKATGRPSNEQMTKCEVDILREAYHENIIKFYDFFEDKHFLYVVLEKCDGGELFYQIVRRRSFTEADAAILCRQALSALDYLHSRGIVHRDIKAENFLFKSKASSSPIKLIDFGMSARVDKNAVLSDLCGSPHYISPELIRKKYDSQADMWAFGVMIYLMLFGRYPFDGTRPADIAMEIVHKELDWSADESKRLTSPSKDFLQRLLEKDPKNRMTAAAALKHPWITEESEFKTASVIPREHIEHARRRSLETEQDRLRTDGNMPSPPVPQQV